MKCLILAAGYATRLYPLTENFPKPLLKVGDKAILDWLIDDIDGAGLVDEYIVISNHKFARHFQEWAAAKTQKVTIVDDGTERIAFQKKCSRKKVLAIVGPTASGKTAFGIRCAGEFNGEIISGDSIQIYRGLDIGSAKPDTRELSEARHHLIDIKDPDENYSVKEFQELSRSCIDRISDEGKLPIIVGGTGLYIKAALYDYVFFEEDEEDDQYEDLSNAQLYELLQEKDPKALEKIHINNR